MQSYPLPRARPIEIDQQGDCIDERGDFPDRISGGLPVLCRCGPQQLQCPEGVRMKKCGPANSRSASLFLLWREVTAGLATLILAVKKRYGFIIFSVFL